ncbi:hypothetical protein Dimus_000607 [Dionaea muscipula]
MGKSRTMSPRARSTLALFCIIVVVSSISFCHGTAATFLLTRIAKDQQTLQYTTTVYLKTPLQPTKLVVDVGAQFSWVDCQGNSYNSTTYSHTPCNSTLCAALNSLACSNCYTPPAPDCGNFTCALFPENPIANNASIDDAIIDCLDVPTTDGSNPGLPRLVSDFVFSCSKNYMLKDLAQNATGFLALGRANYSFPYQLSRDFSLPNIFALCLSGSTDGSGVGLYGSAGPYNFLPGDDLSQSLTYTPLILNPFSDTIITYALNPSFNYFIGVTGIRINGQDVSSLNKTLLAIDPNSGIGGTRISTVEPYTVLQRSIYDAVAAAFQSAAKAMNLTEASPIKPFKVCYYASSVTDTILGPAVPTIDLVLENGVYWRIWGANSVVGVKKKKSRRWCLGFMDGGLSPRASIVVGGFQMEDNLVQIDLVENRFGFSSSVLGRRTTCADFNFTVNTNIH